MDMEEEAKRYDSHPEDYHQMLQDDQVRAAILHGCQGEYDAVSKSMEQSSMAEAIPKDPLPSETAALAVRLKEIEASVRKQAADIKELQESLQSAKQQISDLKMQMGEHPTEKKTHDEEKVRIEKENQRLRGEVNDLQTKNQNLSGEVKNLQAKNQNLSSEVKDLQAKNQNLSGEVKDLQAKNRALQEQLDARFSRGWELFEAYRKVSEHTRQILHNGVFTQEASFMSFICGGAQLTALDRLWDALRDCVLRGQQDDAEILWDIFEYCLELVNASRTQAKYEILSVKVGDSFDSDCHTEGPNSRAQGIVREVYLQGYRNTYGDRIMKKSIVQVG